MQTDFAAFIRCIQKMIRGISRWYQRSGRRERSM